MVLELSGREVMFAKFLFGVKSEGFI